MALTAPSRRAYAEVLKLRLSDARALLRAELAANPAAPAPLLVANTADFVELVVSQDASRYEALTAHRRPACWPSTERRPAPCATTPAPKSRCTWA